MKLTNLIPASALILTIAGSITGQSQKTDVPNGETTGAQVFRLRGGLVNFAEGVVECVRDGRPIAKVRARQALANGDTIQTGEGRVEILLNPGYYVRLSNNTLAQFVDLSPGNLKIKLLTGSAIIEIAIFNLHDISWRMELNERRFEMVTVVTPRDEYAIPRGGAYRFNVHVAGSDLKVLKGLAVVAGATVKDGMMASVQARRVALAPFDKKAGDAFDNWSRDRAVGLLQSNKSLKNTDWHKQMQNDRAYLDILNPPETTKSGRTVSARSGIVGFVEIGMFLRAGESAWQKLKTGDSLSNGDRVRTASESRAEIRPYPYFYLYLGGNTEIVYSEQQDGDVTVTLVKGAAVINAFEPDPKPREQNALNLIAEKAQYRIAQKGSYRLNVLSEGKSEMLVYDGAVGIPGGEIKATKRVVLAGSGATELPLNKQEQDSFDVWGNRRSARQTHVTRRRIFVGLWCLNEAVAQYTFVPAEKYVSPYGGEYSVRYRPNPPIRLRPGYYLPRRGIPERP